MAARCVNVALFLSNAMRRDVVLSICIGDDAQWEVISFFGETLKRVSPDERSISFFILKAIDAVNRLDDGDTFTLDNGIVVERVAPAKFLGRWEHIRMASDRYGDDWQVEGQTDVVYLYDVDSGFTYDEKDFVLVPKTKTPERFILDINMIYDRTE